MPKTKIISKKSTDVFKTFRGTLISRKELSAQIRKVNRVMEYQRNYLTEKEYNSAKERYNRLIKEVYGAEETPSKLTIKGVHDVMQLKFIEQISHEMSTSPYFNRNRYSQMVDKQVKGLMATINAYGDVLDYKTAKHLRSVFATDEWNHLIENKLLASAQTIKMIAKYGVTTKAKMQKVVDIIKNVEADARSAGVGIDDMLELRLNEAFGKR